ncbi:MAG: 6-bladed beta-propeller [Nitrospirae bacterium]|nr:6-bladed beta-propeller [Nitrospirota bacterium]
MVKAPLFFLFVAGLLVSCAPSKALIDSNALEKIFWPGPPERARIAYLWTVSSWSSGGSGGIADFFAGAPDSADPQSASRLLAPYSLFLDGEDQLFITDPGAFRVTSFNTRTGEIRHILKAGKEDFISPVGVVVFKGNVYVSDSQVKKVFIFDAVGKLSGAFDGSFERPTGLALDKERGFIYVSDTLANSVYQYTPEGKRLGSIGRKGTGPGEFNFPTHLWVDKKGVLYVTDAMNFRVEFFSPEGRFLGMFGELGDAYGELEKPKGVASDSDGNIYVVDSIRDMVKIFNREGKLLMFFGSQGKDYGQFWLPSGIFIDRKDHIYIADTYNGRIQVFKYLKEK